MSTPTATPRTDDEETPLITNHRVSAETYKRMVDLARALETELAAERAKANARAERAEADTARLNWLAVSDVWFDFPATGAFTPETMRAAIDAAMKP